MTRLNLRGKIDLSWIDSEAAVGLDLPSFPEEVGRRLQPILSTGMVKLLLLSFFCLMCAGWHEAQAQILDPSAPRASGPTAFYRFAESGNLTMHVKVWGDVRTPGLYEVPQGMSLSTLLTLAGGPTTTTNTSVQRVMLNVRLVRDQGVQNAEVFRATMDGGITEFEEDPTLEGGDTLIIERVVQPRFTWRDALPIVSTATSVGVLILQITSLRRR